MTLHFRNLSLLAMMILCGMTSAGEEQLAVELPPVGAWARYHGVTKPSDGPEAAYQSTIRVLGELQHNGRDCRWIEVEERYGAQDGQISQYLIPKTALLNSARPMDEVVRVIRRDREGKIVSESANGNGLDGINLLFLKSARTGAKLIDEPQTVEYQAGKFTIPRGERGDYSWSTSQSTSKFQLDYTVWVDSKVSLGVAREKMTLTLRQKADDTVIRTWAMDVFLVDFGFDAKSSFPP